MIYIKQFRVSVCISGKVTNLFYTFFNLLTGLVVASPGHYCVFGDPNPVPCPAGTYNNATGQDEESDCQDCTVGQYCGGTGNTLPDGESPTSC